MAEILNSGMMWRGYNTADATNSDTTLTAGQALAVPFDQSCNRLVVLNYGPYPVNVTLGRPASSTAYDILLQPGQSVAGGINVSGIGLWSAGASHVVWYPLREDNTAP